MNIVMDDYLENSKREYTFYKKHPKEYEKRMNDISDLFNLKKSSRFKTDRIPKFWTGQLNNKEKIIFFGLNPGTRSKTAFSDKAEEKSWKTYKKTREKFFHELAKKKGLGPYHRDYYKLICGLFDKEYNKKIDWDFFHDRTLSLNLFPYHSNQTNLPGRLSAAQLSFLLGRLDLLLEFAKTQKPKLCIFNAKIWKILFIDHKLVKKPKKMHIINDFYIYFFRYQGMQCLLFNHFLSSSRHDGVTDKILYGKIPRVILKQYPKTMRLKW